MSSLYRYAGKSDFYLVPLCVLCASAGGAVQALVTVLYGQIAALLRAYTLGNVGMEAYRHELGRLSLFFVYICVIEMATVFVATAGFNYIGDRITRKIKQDYFRAILRQGVAVHENAAGQRLAENSELVQAGISQKLANGFSCLSCFVTAIIIGLCISWKLTLILSAGMASMLAVFVAGPKAIGKYTRRKIIANMAASAHAGEILGSIETVIALGNQERFSQVYDGLLKTAATHTFHNRCAFGLMMGAMFFVMYSITALGLWEGSKLLVQQEISIQHVVTVTSVAIVGAFALGDLIPVVVGFTTALTAGAKLNEFIDQVPEARLTTSEELPNPADETVHGNVELEEITFRYPSRPEVLVLKGINISIKAGSITALVGPSGSGKSSIISLIERFYDPGEGRLLLDGIDTRYVDSHWLRRRISLVSQEQYIFNTTVFENIALGLIGSENEHLDAAMKKGLVIEAAKLAYAHDFICALPKGYETQVAESGRGLSGGQRQRICIARAIISKPMILLLDEPTSALDVESESIVQAALDCVSQGRTTLIVAHRLHTIRNADCIVVMQNGYVVEQGTHNELMDLEKVYYSMVLTQDCTAANPPKRPLLAPSRNDTKSKSFWNKSRSFRFSRLRNSNSGEDYPAHQAKFGSQNYLIQTQEDAETSLEGISSNLEQNESEIASTHDSISIYTICALVTRLIKPELILLCLGIVTSIIAGLTTPTQAILYSKSIASLALPISDSNLIRSRVDLYAALFVALGVVRLLAFIAQATAFGLCAERSTWRARSLSFRKLLRLERAYFDHESTGALTSIYLERAEFLAQLTGPTIGLCFNGFTNIATSYVLAFVFCWKLALVSLCTLPLVVGSGFLQFFVSSNSHKRLRETQIHTAVYTTDIITNIMSVLSLGAEDHVSKLYGEQLLEQSRKDGRHNLQNSALYAASKAAISACSALLFWYGGTLVGKHEYSIQQFYLGVWSAIFSIREAANVLSTGATELSNAKSAAKAYQVLMDRKSSIDPLSSGAKTQAKLQGKIEFSNVVFHYPRQLQRSVLKGFNLEIAPGQTIAIVGSSGCGKTTVLRLIERFYDPTAGKIFIDGIDLSTLDVASYRAQIAMVAQQECLFSGTILENLELGLSDDEAEKSTLKEHIERACKDANIYNFITSLPNGFDTNVGSQGVLLSGGQRQRLAIARALLRNPKILLLDEATSALDGENEKAIQSALRDSRRTTVIVAHRLSTVRSADKIVFVERGRVIAQGTHEQMLVAESKYAKWCMMDHSGEVNAADV